MGKGVRLKEVDIGGIAYLSKAKYSNTDIALQTGIPLRIVQYCTKLFPDRVGPFGPYVTLRDQ